MATQVRLFDTTELDSAPPVAPTTVYPSEPTRGGPE
jgi:hypothetical protein